MTETRTRHMLRVAADAALNPDAPMGSAYLYAIAVAYLAATDDVQSAALETTLKWVTADEGVDSDEILNFLLLRTSD